MKRYLFFVSQLYSLSIVRPLQKAIRERGDEVAWFLNQKQYADYLNEDEKQLATVQEVMDYNPSAVFVASNTVPDFFPGIKVQLFHGFNAQKRDENKGHFRLRGFFDLYCTQGPSTTEPFKELAKEHQNFEVVETGWSKMDPLFEPFTAKPFFPGNSDAQTPQAKKPVILMTSTFTPALSAAYHLFEQVKRMSKREDWNWLITFHPKMDPEIVSQYKSLQSDNLHFVETDDIIPLLQEADLMLSDTSSIISEFLLQQKPAVTFKNRVPGPHLANITDADDIEQAIEQALTKPAELMSAIEDYINLIHPYMDGKSSHRVIDATDALVDSGMKHLKRKPLNLFRRLKVRHKYGYYKFW
ncbi:UDP-N-acetylglucosamine 2-epimerase [Thalassomonas sp. RHCl1]|uniref:UDP-N-acetylglucosamine 2-epimerase n=1 Tax=Thalassomonas sp. RHCl1 TaxID=2995320 RepID=UPI00248A9A4A|nr:UDP-N-acetylglucosamine 2-epimerase [Thalassomonas sp. RHCl1]